MEWIRIVLHEIRMCELKYLLYIMRNEDLENMTFTGLIECKVDSKVNNLDNDHMSKDGRKM